MAIEIAVSIVMPVRNGQFYLETAIDNISSYARDFDEIIVIDDGSSDLTFQILSEWSNNDSRVNLIQTDGIGLADSLNLALLSAKHGWIARADVDDICSSDRITFEVESITPKVAAIFSDYRLTTLTGKQLGAIPTAIFPLPMKLSLVGGNRTPHPSVLFRRDFAVAAGGYLNSEFPAEDLGLWIRIQKYGELVSVPISLLSYTINANSVTTTKRKLSIEKRRKVLSDLEFSKEEMKLFCTEFKSYVEEYLQLSSGHKRIALLYKDLFLWNMRNKNRFPIYLFFHPVVFDPKFISSILGLSIEFLMRRSNRLLSKYS